MSDQSKLDRIKQLLANHIILHADTKWLCEELQKRLDLEIKPALNLDNISDANEMESQ